MKRSFSRVSITSIDISVTLRPSDLWYRVILRQIKRGNKARNSLRELWSRSLHEWILGEASFQVTLNGSWTALSLLCWPSLVLCGKTDSASQNKGTEVSQRWAVTSLKLLKVSTTGNKFSLTSFWFWQFFSDRKFRVPSTWFASLVAISDKYMRSIFKLLTCYERMTSMPWLT